MSAFCEKLRFDYLYYHRQRLARSRLWADGKIAEPTGKDRLQLSGIFMPFINLKVHDLNIEMNPHGLAGFNFSVLFRPLLVLN